MSQLCCSCLFKMSLTPWLLVYEHWTGVLLWQQGVAMTTGVLLRQQGCYCERLRKGASTLVHTTNCTRVGSKSWALNTLKWTSLSRVADDIILFKIVWSFWDYMILCKFFLCKNLFFLEITHFNQMLCFKISWIKPVFFVNRKAYLIQMLFSHVIWLDYYKMWPSGTFYYSNLCHSSSFL